MRVDHIKRHGFSEGLSQGSPCQALILASWRRCHDAGVNPQPERLDYHRVSAEELEQRRHGNADLLEAARPHLAWLSKALEATPHGVYLTDREGIVLYSLGTWANLGARGLETGFDWSERRMGTNGAGTAIAANQMVTVVGTEHFMQPLEHCAGIGTPLHAPDGEVMGAVGICTGVGDASPERLPLVGHVGFAIERELAARQHSRSVRHQADALEKELHLMAELDRRKDGLVTMFARELRNPLAPVLNAAQLMRLLGPEDPQLERQCTIIQRQVRHLAKTLEDMLNFLQVRSGNLALRKEWVDLQSILDQATHLVQAELIAKNCLLSLDRPWCSIWLDADPIRLEQILLTLIRNALRSTESGGSIRFTVKIEEPMVLISVCDDGVGIEAHELAGLFDPLLRYTNLAGGNGDVGLGLSLAREVALLHGGELRAHSAGIGKGAEFQLRLPCSLQPVLPETSLPSSIDSFLPRLPPTSTKALVADSNPDAAGTLSELLQLWGCRVLAVHDGQQLLAGIATFKPDLIICEVQLPGIDRRRLPGQVRAQSCRAPLIALATNGGPTGALEAATAGFAAYHEMPVEPDELLASVVAALDASR